MELKEAGAGHPDGGLFPDQEQDVLGGLRLDEGQHVAATTRRIAALLFLTGRADTAIASTQEGLPLSLQTCFGACPID